MAGSRPIADPCNTVPASAIAAFLDLLRQWKLAPARGWRMLTGVGWQAGLPTADQIDRVQDLVAIDAGLRPRLVSEWMMTGNPAPLLCGSSPVDYLTRTGTRGHVALAIVMKWMRRNTAKTICGPAQRRLAN